MSTKTSHGSEWLVPDLAGKAASTMKSVEIAVVKSSGKISVVKTPVLPGKAHSRGESVEIAVVKSSGKIFVVKTPFFIGQTGSGEDSTTG